MLWMVWFVVFTSVCVCVCVSSGNFSSPSALTLSSQGMARMCCDPCRNVRHMAISYLQRALLAHDLQRLSPNEWEACFLEVRGTFWGGEEGAWAWERGTQDGGGGMLEGDRVLCRGVYRSSLPSLPCRCSSPC